MSKLTVVLIASTFSLVSLNALAAEEPVAPTETAKTEMPMKAEKNDHKHKHDHMKKEAKEDKKESAKEVMPETK